MNPIQYLDEPFYPHGSGGTPTPVNGITEFGGDPINTRMALWNQNPGVTRNCKVPYGTNGLNGIMDLYVRMASVCWASFLNNANAVFQLWHDDMPGPDLLDKLPINLAAVPAPIAKENRGFTYYSMELPSQTGDETYYIIYVPRRQPGDGGLYYETEGFTTVPQPYPVIPLPPGKNWRKILSDGKVWSPGSPNGVFPGGLLENWYPGNGGVRVSTPEEATETPARLVDPQGGAPFRNVLATPSRIKVEYTF